MTREAGRSINRRSAIKLGLATGASAMAARISFAAPATTPSRLVVIILRGALERLAVCSNDPVCADHEPDDRSGDRATITTLVVKKNLIEFHLDGLR